MVSCGKNSYLVEVMLPLKNKINGNAHGKVVPEVKSEIEEDVDCKASDDFKKLDSDPSLK